MRVLVVALVAAVAAVGLPSTAVAGPYGRLTGTLTGPGGLPASTIDVNVMHLDEFGQWRSVAYDSTDRDGRFELWAPPGTHRLWFKPYLDTSVYLPEYYPDAATVDLATDITVTADSTQDFAVELEAGPHATVAGTVVGTDGGPVAGVQVGFWNNRGTDASPWWEWRFLDETDATGRFRELIRPGTYRVSYRRAGYAETFHGAAEAVDTASDVVLGDTELVELDAVIKKATRIHGYLRSAPTSVSIPGARVYFYRNTGTEQSPVWSGIGYASPSWDTGEYWMRVPAGAYLVKAYDPYGEYLTEYYDKAFTTGSAKAVAVADEATVSGIDIRMTRRDALPMTANGAPVISGSAEVSSALSASPGTWSPEPARVTYQWFADGDAIVGATDSGYRPSEADLGRVLTVKALAYTPGRLPASQTSAATAPVAATPLAEPTAPVVQPERVSSATRLKAAIRGRTVRLHVRVTASVPARGVVRIFRKTRLLRTVSLESGRASVRLRNQPRGTWTYKAAFGGSATVLPSRDAVRVRVR